MPEGILIFAEQRDGKLKKTSLELLHIAAKLSGELGGSVSAAVIGSGVGDMARKLAKCGAAKVFVVDNDALKEYSTEGYAQAMAAIIKEVNPSIVLAGHTAMGRDLMPRVAAHMETGIVPDCTDLCVDGGKLVAKRPVYSGKAYIEVMLEGDVGVFTVRPNTYPAAEDGDSAGEVVNVDAAIDPASIRAKVVEIRKAATAKPDLTEANIIVSGGRGMKDKDNFKILDELADVIDATVGASRAAVDSGYADQSMQVGQTGKVVNPTLYIACGISGAIQHLAGMRTSKVIVAINKDADAPIFQKADYGIVGDLFKVVPALTEELKKLTAE